MKNILKQNSTLIGFAQLLVGGVLIVWNILQGVSLYRLASYLDKQGLSATATISNYRRNQLLKPLCFKDTQYYNYTIQYQDQNGRIHRQQLAGCRRNNVFRDEATVHILYDPKQPEKFIQPSEVKYILKFILVLIGLVLAVNGVKTLLGINIPTGKKQKR